MAYCTETDIENLVLDKQTIINLTNDDSTGVVDSDKVTAAIERADAEIDKYLSGKYNVPLTAPVPALVKGWSAELSAFFLHRSPVIVPSEIIDRYNKVMSNLSKVSSGELPLPGETGLGSGASVPASTTDNCGHEFRRTKYNPDGTIKELGNMEKI